MQTLWLLRGGHEAPGWLTLEQDARAGRTDVIHFDRDRWALVKADEAPSQYEGLTPEPPPDGLYLDGFGRPCYVAGGVEVHSARAVLRALGEEAGSLMERFGDPDLVLEKLGRAF